MFDEIKIFFVVFQKASRHNTKCIFFPFSSTRSISYAPNKVLMLKLKSGSECKKHYIYSADCCCCFLLFLEFAWIADVKSQINQSHLFYISSSSSCVVIFLYIILMIYCHCHSYKYGFCLLLL